MGPIFKIVGNKSGETGEGGLKMTELYINKIQEEKKKNQDFWKPSNTSDFMSHASRNTLYNINILKAV